MSSGFHRLHALRMENDAKGFLMDEMRPRFDRIANRHENGTAPRAVTAFNLFQTPAPLADQMAELAELSEGLRVLEPSAGLGRLIRAAQSKSERLELVAVEQSPDCAGELFQSHPEAGLYQRDFLTIDPAETGLFDRVVMNPPFKMRRDIRHIEHAATFLKPGGLLVALCLATDHRAKAFKHRAETWQEIPAGAFKSEGTNVGTYLFTIRN